jgi:hypothetical protein
LSLSSKIFGFCQIVEIFRVMRVVITLLQQSNGICIPLLLDTDFGQILQRIVVSRK